MWRVISKMYVWQEEDVQDEVMVQFARRFFDRHGLSTDVPNNFGRNKLPLMVLSRQAFYNGRPWSDVELLLKNLPPQMAKVALMRIDGGSYKRTPLHYAAEYAPSSIIGVMLSLAPDAAFVKDSHGCLPLHIAADGAKRQNVEVVELFLNAHPQTVLEKDFDGKTPLHYAAENARYHQHSKFSRGNVVKLLVKACPKAIFIEDSNGTISLEFFNLDDIFKVLPLVEWSNQALEMGRKRKRR